MPKPSITKRAVKAAALTYAELDNNFQNLADATISMTAGSAGTQVTADLNGNITLVAGTGVTLTGDNTAKTITITSSGGGGASNLDGLSDVTITGTPSLGQILRYTANNVFENVVAGYLSGVIGDTNPSLGGNLETNGKTISDSSGRVVISDQLNVTGGSAAGNGINIGYVSGGSFRIECQDALIIASETTFEGTVSGPRLNMAKVSGIGSMTVGCGLDPQDRIILDDIVRINSLSSTDIASSTPTNGDLVYNTTTHKFQGYANGTWVDLH